MRVLSSIFAIIILFQDISARPDWSYAEVSVSTDRRIARLSGYLVGKIAELRQITASLKSKPPTSDDNLITVSKYFLQITHNDTLKEVNWFTLLGSAATDRSSDPTTTFKVLNSSVEEYLAFVNYSSSIFTSSAEFISANLMTAITQALATITDSVNSITASLNSIYSAGQSLKENGATVTTAALSATLPNIGTLEGIQASIITMIKQTAIIANSLREAVKIITTVDRQLILLNATITSNNKILMAQNITSLDYLQRDNKSLINSLSDAEKSLAYASNSVNSKLAKLPGVATTDTQNYLANVTMIMKDQTATIAEAFNNNIFNFIALMSSLFINSSASINNEAGNRVRLIASNITEGVPNTMACGPASINNILQLASAAEKFLVKCLSAEVDSVSLTSRTVWDHLMPAITRRALVPFELIETCARLGVSTELREAQTEACISVNPGSLETFTDNLNKLTEKVIDFHSSDIELSFDEAQECVNRVLSPYTIGLDNLYTNSYMSCLKI